MSMIYYPGVPVETFFTDLLLEEQPPGSLSHGTPPRVRDGRMYLSDKRPDSPWQSHHNARHRWVCCYARPTKRLTDFLDEVHGPGAVYGGSLEIIPWAPSERFRQGALLLMAHPGGEYRVPRYMVTLEVPEYAGWRRGNRVYARWWDRKFYPAEIVGLNADRDWTYRVRFPHATDHGRYVDVPDADITLENPDARPAEAGGGDGHPRGHPV